ncbi:precorrin-3B synthase [Rhizobium sp. RAF56]|uniref:precorrin-3B synthase n=1 Tax=Rhizobium sp. RAF56 TaxID=3233062 RepID=UPI003F9B3D1D
MSASEAQAREPTEAQRDAADASFLVRGACPSLAAPMATGDGLLVRLRPATPGLTVAQCRELAAAAARHGNGLIEITARGNIQIRGLRQETLTPFAADIGDAGIEVETGVTIETSALAGIDPKEHADALEIAATLREAISAMCPQLALAPKLAIIVDGLGSLRLDDLSADIRLTAEDAGNGRWSLAIAGTAKTARPLHASLSTSEAVAAIHDVLRALARVGPRARGRDLISGLPHLPREVAPAPVAPRQRTTPIGVHRLGATSALGLRLAYGQIQAADLSAFLLAAERLGASEMRAAHDHALIILGLNGASVASLQALAARYGLSADAGDPANRIAVCAGAGGCASAFYRTRDVAALLIAETPAVLDGSYAVHLSGCAKGCAHPAPSTIALVGTPIGYGLVVNGSASAEPIAYIREDDLKSALQGLARLVRDEKEAGESVSACLTRLDTHRIRAALGQR